MKKLQITDLSILMLCVIICKEDKIVADTPTEISNNPASGTIYNQNFVVNCTGETARNITSSGVEKVYIALIFSNRV